MTTPAKALYYAFYIASRATSARGTSLCVSQPFDTIAEAKAHAKRVVDQGEATLSVVVVFEGGEKRPLKTWVWPTSACKIIGHWEDILDATEDAP